MSTAACKNYSQLMLNRFLLGALESAIAPTFSVYISFWWTRREQALRNAACFGSLGLGMTFGPLFSYGLGVCICGYVFCGFYGFHLLSFKSTLTFSTKRC